MPQLTSAVFLPAWRSCWAPPRAHRFIWHLPTHTVGSSCDRQRADALTSHLLAGDCDPPCATSRPVRARRLPRGLLRRMARGEAFQVVRDLFYLRPTVGRLCATAEPPLAMMPIRAADFRDCIGGGKHAIRSCPTAISRRGDGRATPVLPESRR